MAAPRDRKRSQRGRIGRPKSMPYADLYDNHPNPRRFRMESSLEQRKRMKRKQGD